MIESLIIEFSVTLDLSLISDLDIVELATWEFSIVAFSSVDPVAVEDIQRIISKLTKKNIGILITDHNVQETLAITDRTYLMFEGNILKDGKPEISGMFQILTSKAN